MLRGLSYPVLRVKRKRDNKKAHLGLFCLMSNPFFSKTSPRIYLSMQRYLYIANVYLANLKDKVLKI